MQLRETSPIIQPDCIQDTHDHVNRCLLLQQAQRVSLSMFRIFVSEKLKRFLLYCRFQIFLMIIYFWFFFFLHNLLNTEAPSDLVFQQVSLCVTRGCIFHMVHMQDHSRQYSGLSGGVMLLLLLLLLLLVAYSVCQAQCYSQPSSLPVPSCSQWIRLPYCVCSSSIPAIPPPLTCHASNAHLHSSPHPTPHSSIPQTATLNARTCTDAAALLSGPTCSSTTGKWLLLLLVRNQWN